MKYFNLTKLLLGGILLLSLSACNKEPADVGTVPADYDLQSAINELPTESKTNTETDVTVPTTDVANDISHNSIQKDMPSVSKSGGDASSLVEACFHNDLAKFRELIKSGQNINGYYKGFDAYPTTPLSCAIQTHRKEMVKDLLEAGVNVNQLFGEDISPLWLAVETEQTDIVRQLILAGADVNFVNYYEGEGGTSLLDLAQESPEIVALLKQAGAKENSYPGFELYDDFRKAIQTGNVAKTKILLQKGANVDQLIPATYMNDNPEGDIFYETPLMNASLNGNMPLVKELIQAGANVNQTYIVGGDKQHEPWPWFYDSALDSACYKKHLEIVNLLFESGASPQRLLFCAAWLGDVSLLQTALKAGAEINSPRSEHEFDTALMEAAHKGNKEMVQALIQAGANADFHYLDIDGDIASVLHSAKDYPEIVEILKQAGAKEHEWDEGTWE